MACGTGCAAARIPALGAGHIHFGIAATDLRSGRTHQRTCAPARARGSVVDAGCSGRRRGCASRKTRTAAAKGRGEVEGSRARGAAAAGAGGTAATAASAAMPATAPEAFPASEAERDQGDATAARAGGTLGAAGKDAAVDKLESQRRANGAPAPSSSVELRRDMQLDADTWLAHIEQLLRQGRRQQAIESLRLFRNAHPRHALPDELRALLD